MNPMTDDAMRRLEQLERFAREMAKPPSMGSEEKGWLHVADELAEIRAQMVGQDGKGERREQDATSAEAATRKDPAPDPAPPPDLAELAFDWCENLYNRLCQWYGGECDEDDAVRIYRAHRCQGGDE